LEDSKLNYETIKYNNQGTIIKKENESYSFISNRIKRFGNSKMIFAIFIIIYFLFVVMSSLLYFNYILD